MYQNRVTIGPMLRVPGKSQTSSDLLFIVILNSTQCIFDCLFNIYNAYFVLNIKYLIPRDLQVKLA